MKQIVPNCEAIITKGLYSGMPVHVVDRVPRANGNRMPNGHTTTGGPGMWLVILSSPMMASFEDGSRRETNMGSVHERHLLRIDGDEHVTTEEREGEEVSA